jgi:hypothetical protein
MFARMKQAKGKAGDSAKNEQRSPYFRSRVSAGLSLLPTIDGRSAHARVFKDTYAAMVSHCGGKDLPETMRLMCRRAAALESELVNLECRFAELRASGAEPKPSDLDLHSRLTNTLRRVCEVIGWRRTARDITPDPLEYARAFQIEAEDVTA